jgi:hypothetical protein
MFWKIGNSPFVSEIPEVQFQMKEEVFFYLFIVHALNVIRMINGKRQTTKLLLEGRYTLRQSKICIIPAIALLKTLVDVRVYCKDNASANRDTMIAPEYFAYQVSPYTKTRRTADH